MAIPTNASLEAKLNAVIDKQTDEIKSMKRKLDKMNDKMDKLLALVRHSTNSSDSSDEELDENEYAKLIEFHPAWVVAKADRARGGGDCLQG
jgi:hypothetical protein